MKSQKPWRAYHINPQNCSDAKKNIVKNVNQIILNVLAWTKLGDIVPDADLYDNLGASSLDLVELWLRLEQKFDISIPCCFAEYVRSVGDVYDCVGYFICRRPINNN